MSNANTETEGFICPKHGGPWGGDETCNKCTDADGRPRSVPAETDWFEWGYDGNSIGNGGAVSIRKLRAGEETDVLEVTFYKGEEDGKPVIQVDGDGDFRINVNDGTVFDRHTDSSDAIGDAALKFYQHEVEALLEGRNGSYTRERLVELRTELLGFGYAGTAIDSRGKLIDWGDVLDGMSPVELRDLARAADVKAQALTVIAAREDAREAGK